MISYQKKKKNLVVGCGLSGAVLAERLASILDEDVLIMDKAPYLGGMIYDYMEDGIFVHKFGSHVFHTNFEYVFKYLNKFSDFIPYMHKEAALAEGNFISLPFNLNSIYNVFPKKLAERLENKLIKKYGWGEKVSILDIKTKPFFWDKDLDFLASYIYENVFIHYANKKWDRRDLDLSNVCVHINRDDRAFNDKYQGIFKEGYTKLIENILNHKNIKILLDVDFKNIDASGFDRIFYTGSIDEFFDYKFGMLQYRSARFEISKIENEFYQKTGVVKYPNNYDFIKIHEFKHYSDAKTSNTVIAREYVSDYLQNNDTERVYPVYSKRNADIFKQYKIEAKKLKDVYFLGRLGDFKNYSMDMAAKRAFEVFENVRLKSVLEENALFEDEQLIVK